MRRLRKELRAIRSELREARLQISAVENEVRRLRRDRLDDIVGSMRRSAREMLRMSRGL